MMPKKTVILVRSDIRMAGPGKLMQGIARGLRTRGWEVEIVTGGGELAEQFEADGFRHHTIPGLRIGDRSPGAMLAGAKDLRRLASQVGSACIHSFNAHAGLLAWLSTRGLGVSVINTVLGAGKERLLRYLPFPLIAVSNFVRDDLIEHGIAPSKITVVYNGIIPEHRLLPDRVAFEALWRERATKKPFRFMSIAMMHGDKGHARMIEAANMLAARENKLDFELYLIGDGVRRAELEALAKQLGVGDKVRFVGAVDDVYPLLDEAHAFIHLSPQETFGMVLAEAHARGLACIAGGVGGIPEVVADGVSGILVDPHNVPAVVDAMQKFLAEPETVRSMGANGLDRTKRLFTEPRLAENLERAYSRL